MPEDTAGRRGTCPRTKNPKVKRWPPNFSPKMLGGGQRESSTNKEIQVYRSKNGGPGGLKREKRKRKGSRRACCCFEIRGGPCVAHLSGSRSFKRRVGIRE